MPTPAGPKVTPAAMSPRGVLGDRGPGACQFPNVSRYFEVCGRLIPVISIRVAMKIHPRPIAAIPTRSHPVGRLGDWLTARATIAATTVMCHIVRRDRGAVFELAD